MSRNGHEIPIAEKAADFSAEDQTSKSISKLFLIFVFLLLALGLSFFFLTGQPAILLLMMLISVGLWFWSTHASKGIGFDINPIIINSESIDTKGATIHGGAGKKDQIKYDEIASIEVLKESSESQLPDSRQRKMMIIHTIRGEEVIFKAWDGQFIDQAIEKVKIFSKPSQAPSSNPPAIISQVFNNRIDNRWEWVAVSLPTSITFLMVYLASERLLESFNNGSTRSSTGAVVFIFLSVFFAIMTIKLVIDLNVVYYREIEVTEDHVTFGRVFPRRKMIAWGEIRGIQFPEACTPEKNHGYSLVLSRGKPTMVDREIALALISGYRNMMGVEPTRFINWRDNYRSLQD